MRYLIIALALLVGPVAAADTQFSVGISLPGISIGINQPAYPQMVQVPGYPVYYEPRANFNYFFFDGMYWVFQSDNWYASSWYDGPWHAVDRQYVPMYILRVPVRYYRSPPTYFRGWNGNQPPRWGQRWGHEWEQQHKDWNKWDRKSAPRPAPLPTYQEQYRGDRYPRQEQQQWSIHEQNYRHQPSEPVVHQYYQQEQRQQQERQKQEQQHQQQAQPDNKGRGNDKSQGKGQDKGKGHDKDDNGQSGKHGQGHD